MGTEQPLKLTDCYCTPCWLARRVGRFNTDPCTNPRSHIDAVIKYMLEHGQDGLNLPWIGRTWMNHPYSDPYPWIQKLHFERYMLRCTESLVLAKLDTSTEWWQMLTNPAHGKCDLWVFTKRINFDIPPDVLAKLQALHDAKCKAKGKPTSTVSTSNNFCSVLVHHRYGLAHKKVEPQPQLELHDVAQLWNKAA